MDFKNFTLTNDELMVLNKALNNVLLLPTEINPYSSLIKKLNESANKEED